MTRLSISLRLAIWYAGISVAGFAVFGVAMWFVLAHSMISWKDRTLQMRATRVQIALASLPRGDQATLDIHLNEVVGVLPEGELINVYGSTGQLLFPQNRTSQAPDLPWPFCETTSARDHLVGKEAFRQLCSPAVYAGQRAYVVVPSPLMEDRILLRAFTQGLYRTIPFILMVSGVGGYVLSRRALKPVDLLIAEARTITPENLSRRLTVSAPDDQLQRLALEWNSLLARIHAAMVKVTQFTADASHELRTPVAYIRAIAEYNLGNPSLDGETREGLNAIVDETKLMGELLENLLTLARLDLPAGAQTCERTEVAPVIAEVVAYFKPMVRQKGQTLTIEEQTGHETSVLISKLHLRRILAAIVENAIKYTPAGGKISVVCKAQETVDVIVADNGVGIAPEHLDRIFDRFYRVDQARTDLSEGVGLGLPIAKLMTELYGGGINVTSRHGDGTTFVVHFPGNPRS